MSSIGPQLPPHLTKRKRTPDDDGSDRAADPTSPPTKQARCGPSLPPSNNDEIDLGEDDDSDGDDFGPAAPVLNGASRPAAGPAMPPPPPLQQQQASNHDEIALGESDSDDSDTGPQPPSANHKPSIAGPAPPPPTYDTAPQQQQDDASSSDSEDDYGPAPPGSSRASKPTIGPAMPPHSSEDAAPQRDSWMLAPPPSSSSQSSSYAERDPTRLRSRKFASKPTPSGRGSNPPGTSGSGISAIWTETPEEKLRRLQDSVLGRKDPAAAAGEDDAAGRGSKARAEQEERDRRIAANVEAQRGKSLYQEHQTRRDRAGAGNREEDDDPSKRGFDREKDMALGGQIGSSQRREMMTKAANFGGKFQKGSFL